MEPSSNQNFSFNFMDLGINPKLYVSQPNKAKEAKKELESLKIQISQGLLPKEQRKPIKNVLRKIEEGLKDYQGKSEKEKTDVLDVKEQVMACLDLIKATTKTPEELKNHPGYHEAALILGINQMKDKDMDKRQAVRAYCDSILPDRSVRAEETAYLIRKSSVANDQNYAVFTCSYKPPGANTSEHMLIGYHKKNKQWVRFQNLEKGLNLWRQSIKLSIN